MGTGIRTIAKASKRPQSTGSTTWRAHKEEEEMSALI